MKAVASAQETIHDLWAYYYGKRPVNGADGLPRTEGTKMSLRIVVVLVGLGMLAPAMAGELTPDEARRFVAGKLFSYSCFDGTTGLGRIQADGSVIGTLQARGGLLRQVALPTGTIKVSSDSICASVRGALFQPCFNVTQTSASSFRGSIAGFGFAYCDFVHRNPRHELARPEARPHAIHSAVVLRPSRE